MPYCDANPELNRALETAGLIFAADDRTTPEYPGKFVASEIAQWAVPIKAGGIAWIETSRAPGSLRTIQAGPSLS